MLIKGTEILASGSWPGSSTITVDESDLDGIVNAFNARKDAGRIPLKLGHEDSDIRDGTRQFALGWVTRLWREGSRLMADFDVPQKVFSAIKEGYLKFVSVELLKNVQAANRVLPWVLDAVALLGTDQPAVGILGDLQALTLRRRTPSSRSGSLVTLSSSSRKDQSTEDMEMDKSEVDKIVKEAVALATKPLTERLEVAEKSAKEANEALVKANDEKKKNAIKLKREQIDELFNVAIEAGGIEPKVREAFARLTRYDKKDEAIEEIEMKEVKDFIEENTDKVKLAAKKKEKEKLQTQAGAKDEDEGKPADVRLANRVKKVALSRGKDHNNVAVTTAITLEILREDKTLAKAYQMQVPAETEEGK
jgi:hypothetical protein